MKLTTLVLILSLAGCASAGSPLIQAGGVDKPMIQAGSATQPVIGKDAVNLTLTPTTNLNAQVGSKDGPLVEVKPSLSINMGELGPSIEKSVMYALLGLLLIVIVKELFSHFLAKRRNRA